MAFQRQYQGFYFDQIVYSWYHSSRETFDGSLHFQASHINLGFYPFIDHHLSFAVTHLTQLIRHMNQVSQSNHHQVYQAERCDHLLLHRPDYFLWSSRVVLCLKICVLLGWHLTQHQNVTSQQFEGPLAGSFMLLTFSYVVYQFSFRSLMQHPWLLSLRCLGYSWD